GWHVSRSADGIRLLCRRTLALSWSRNVFVCNSMGFQLMEACDHSTVRRSTPTFLEETQSRQAPTTACALHTQQSFFGVLLKSGGGDATSQAGGRLRYSFSTSTSDLVPFFIKLDRVPPQASC
ncbi:unnamed protein product, partial [Ectocarpus sp. 6 AP-2014]